MLVANGLFKNSLASFGMPSGPIPITVPFRSFLPSLKWDKIRAAACAEMRVQRTAEFFDASQPADTPAGAQNALNRVFGRRYEIEFFRWVPADEL